MTKQLHDGDTTGVELGRDANDKVGFFGATPVTQQVSADTITTTVVLTQVGATVVALHAALASLGLITGS